MKKRLRKHLLPLVVVIIWCALDISCLWRGLFGVPCPTCGMTRAVLCLFRLDFPGYCVHNAMALPVTAAVLLLIHLPAIKSKAFKGCCLFAAVVVLGINLFYYLYRLKENCIP